jgi:protein-tyrosine phosphatase
VTPFRILTVCTGNVCRSPMAERLLRAGLRNRCGGQADDVEVSSAGTGALVGEAMTAQTRALVDRLGAESGAHTARALAEDLVERADLVLALTRRHRSAVVTLHPRATRRTFTLREAARLAALVEPGELPDAPPAERLRALVPLLGAKRGLVAVDDPAVDDVADPFRRSDEVYEQMAAELAPAVTVLLDVVTPHHRRR